MAPNQQSLASIAESLSNLDLSTLVKPEFLPLTHPKEQQQAASPVTPTPTQSESDDYWSWTPSVEVEEAAEVTCASRIEEQLLRDAQRRSLKVETVTSTTPAQAENYWDEATENDSSTDSSSPVVQAQHEESYWEWKSDAKDVFAVDSIVDNLVAQSEHLQTKTTDTVKAPSSTVPVNYWDEATDDVIRATRTHANYWTWDSDAKQELVDTILKQREAHVLTSGCHIQENLVRDASDAYWNESPVVTASDQYWNWEASPQQVACAGAGAENYWDW